MAEGGRIEPAGVARAPQRPAGVAERARQLVDDYDSDKTIDLLDWAADARAVLREVSR